MKLPITLLVALLLSIQLPAQKSQQPTTANEYAAIDKRMLEIPAARAHSAKEIAEYINTLFKTEEEKVRAAFIWVASNLQYDIANIFAINFYENSEDRVARAFATGKGVCIDYANIFNDICNLCGVQSHVVSGYNQTNGVSNYLSHAWCVTKLNGEWYIFDPTWGSGYISNQKFVTKIDNTYFKASPSAIIKSHMPFDPMWECLNYPVTNAEFYEGNVTLNTTKPYFSYKDSIKLWESQDITEQSQSAARRIEANGVKNSMIYDHLYHLKKQVAYIIDSTQVATYNAASTNYTEAVNEYNVYVKYKNSQFTPKKSDIEIRRMIDRPDSLLVEARKKVAGIKNPKPNVLTLIPNFNKAMDEIQELVDTEKEFVTKYLSKGKFARSFMFTNLFSTPSNKK